MATQTPPPPPSLTALAWPLLVHHRWKAIFSVAALPLAALMAMLVPYVTKLAIDDYIMPAKAQGHVEAVWPQLSALAAVAGVLVLLGYLADALYVSLVQRTGMAMLNDLREQLYRRTLRLPRAYFDNHPIGSILTRITSDFEALGEGLAVGVLSLFSELLKMLGYLGMMFWLNWRLTLLLCLMGPPLALIIHFFQGRVRKHFFRARQALSEATGFLQESLTGMKTVQLFHAEEQVLRRFKEKNARFFHAQNKSNLYDALLFSLVEGLTSLSLALLLWWAAGDLLSGMLTLGVLVAFLEYIQRLFVPLREFSQQVAVLQRAMAALDHIGDLFATPLDPAETLPQAPAAPPLGMDTLSRLTFEDVHFRYQPQGQEVLKGVSFEVVSGKTLAIVGATGSGKSTLIRLLTRAYTGYQGAIRINGRELGEISAQELFQRISVVHQNVFLFQGSVAQNIGLGSPHLSRADIEQAARYVHAHDFIQRLEGGYDFVVAQGGQNLSAGQGQLIAFARTVAAHNQLIVLDEATASVDSFTESLIQKALERLYQDKTVIAIAHRLSTVRHAHSILVLDKGRVVEQGNHQTLMAQNGHYARLVGELAHEGGDSP